MHNRNCLDYDDQHLDHLDHLDQQDHRDHLDPNRSYCTQSRSAVKAKNFQLVRCNSASHNYDPKLWTLFWFGTRALIKERNSSFVGIFFSPQRQEHFTCTFSHGVQSLLGIATEVVIMIISVAIHSKGKNRPMSTHLKIKKKNYKELCYKYTLSQSQTTLQTVRADSLFFFTQPCHAAILPCAISFKQAFVIYIYTIHESVNLQCVMRALLLVVHFQMIQKIAKLMD